MRKPDIEDVAFWFVMLTAVFVLCLALTTSEHRTREQRLIDYLRSEGVDVEKVIGK